MRKEIEELIKKASFAHDSSDAMRFSQAAQNAANALCALANYENIPTTRQEKSS